MFQMSQVEHSDRAISANRSEHISAAAGTTERDVIYLSYKKHNTWVKIQNIYLIISVHDEN